MAAKHSAADTQEACSCRRLRRPYQRKRALYYWKKLSGTDSKLQADVVILGGSTGLQNTTQQRMRASEPEGAALSYLPVTGIVEGRDVPRSV